MSYLTVNGIECVRGKITIPLTGCWVADIVAEPQSATGQFPNPGGSVTMTIGQQSFQGIVRRSSNPFGTVFARLIGGAGGLPTELEPRAYQNTTAQNVLRDALDDCGEVLASSSDQTGLNQSLASWVRLAGPGWQTLGNLVEYVDVFETWRVLPSGQIWVGAESWPQTNLQSYELLSYLPHDLRAEIYSDTPSILPGQSFLGGEVTSVEHDVEPAKVVTTVLFLDQQLAKVEAGNG